LRSVIVIIRRKETKMQAFVYRDKKHVNHEMYDYSSNDWDHRNRNKRFKETCGSYSTTFNTFITKDSYTWNIARNTESIAV
jgi:hypothetical protein